MRIYRLREILQSIALYEFAPIFSREIRRLFYNPLGVLIPAALASLLCGLFLHSQGFVLCGAILVVVALGVLWPWLTIMGMQGKMSFARDRVSEGESVDVGICLRNRFPWGARGLTVIEVESAKNTKPFAAISMAPGRRVVDCHWEFVPTTRGIYPLTVPRLANGFPFGLHEAQCRLEIEKPLIVWPRTFAVGPIPPVSGENRVEGNVSRSKVGSNGDVLGVRPYRRGDSPRRIHWGQSARQDRLIVCELESNSRPLIQIILDADLRVHSGIGPDSSLEWAIRIVASFAEGWLEEGAQVGVSWGDQNITPASGRSHLIKILDALAGLVPEKCQPLAKVLACPKCRNFRDGLQVIITTDRTHAHDGCGACESESQRWVVLKAQAFTGDRNVTSCGHCPQPWLTLDSPRDIPAALRGEWREARHGS